MKLKWNLFYIGETGDTLEKRISQHLNHIRKLKPFEKYHEKEVAKHFRRTGHSLKYFKVCVFRAELIDVIKRKNYELDLVNRLNINKKKDVLTSLKRNIIKISFLIINNQREDVNEFLRLRFVVDFDS